MAGPFQEIMPPDIPSLPGSYGLCLILSAPMNLQIGQLGRCAFPAGRFVYLGSAWGPGGLRARLGRHIRGTGKLHWHIDWLRKEAVLEMAFFSTSLARLECTWSQVLACMDGAFIPAAKFGAADCRSGCLAHLVGFSLDFPLQMIEERLKQSGSCLEVLRLVSIS
jgi:Uri superfamily endonuclease